ncbi:putative hydrolase [Caenibius tardaugens NBRC 16725]|uniref:Putative hydrolase n=2 Tax=Caenibius TaxID=2827482 RepID=U2YBS3_9SPHN|nr:putative hydrolase [Caenibius tardaugens NBRC 16725]
MLGSGTSAGVPRVGNDWGACDPDDPRNRRTRVSIIVEGADGARLLVDTSTDLRQQLLANEIDRIDAVFWTHDHADHCHGIDDLRALRYGRSGPLPGFASDETVRRLRQRFGYIFSGQYGYPTIVSVDTLDRLRMFAGIRIDTCQMPHGPIESTAYRFDQDGKSIGYATDFSEICDGIVDLFWDIDILVVDCLRREPHPTHANLAMALQLGERCRAHKIVLTHLDKSLDYRSLSDEVPDNVLVGYDGMVLDA